MPTATKKAPAKRKAAPRRKAAATRTPAIADDSASSSSSSSKRPADGALVAHTYFDPRVGAGGEDVTRYGVVVAVSDTQANGDKHRDADGNVVNTARVAWLPDASDPIAVTDLDW